MAGSVLDVRDRLAGVGIDDTRGGHAQAQPLLQLHLAWVTARVGGCLTVLYSLGTGSLGMSKRGCP